MRVIAKTKDLVARQDDLAEIPKKMDKQSKSMAADVGSLEQGVTLDMDM